MADFKVVGSSVPRAEGADKVIGRTLYAADVTLPGTLLGKILRSSYPHARILHMNTANARKVPGVKAIVTGEDTRGLYFGKQIRDMPVLCWDTVRFVGDRVAAVAAEALDAAEEAVGLIEVEYEQLAAVFDPLEAMQSSAPRLHANVTAYEGAPKDLLAVDVHNGMTRLSWRKGDLEQGFRAADVVLEHTFHIPARATKGTSNPTRQSSPSMTTAGSKFPCRRKIRLGFAASSPKRCVYRKTESALMSSMSAASSAAKATQSDLPVAYFLARESGRPVKIVMTYAEELTASNPAHPTVITIRSGVKRDGRILARSLRAVHASGAYGALKSNASLATWHYAGGQYRIDNAFFEFLQIYTNTVPGGYYRSPGAVATAFAVDSHTDMIAKELKMDPGEFRLKNFLGEGEEDAVGHRLHHVRFREVLTAALDSADWRKPKPGPNYGRGIALSGRHISGGDTGLILTAETDGSFTILSPRNVKARGRTRSCGNSWPKRCACLSSG